MHFRFLAVLVFISLSAGAQYKSYRLSDKGDTLNIVDMKGQKQGKWALRMPALRGEPAYEEEGVFVNDRKEGTWMRYNLMGDPLAVENYRWGNKNGLCRYFTTLGVEREESWRAINPDKAFDTIDVRDPIDPNKYEKVIVKNEGASLKHGTWKFFDPTKGRLLHLESYFMDRLRDPNEPDPITGMAKLVATDTSKAKPVVKPKPKEVMEFEKKTSGKKKAVRTGSVG